ncbi:ankyrin repeat-containing protein [Colletotrichum plurivorum]|uniref:Ankyrin repeat-containing protein n=1 Tax=Colletotrichum plurivorum TaxID=2175906 RepID=A0A8H6NB72_9PEZI|nr:ankyrin repeat-containing protein [Colletotrichum plurivorum]
MALVLASSSAASAIPPTKELQDAVEDFQKILNDDQRAELQKLRTIPDADAVLVFTAQLDISAARSRGPSIASRLHSVLQFVRESSAIIDTFVSSHPEIAALVWGGVKMTMQIVLNFTSYYERISDLFMQFGRDCPRFADDQALFPDSTGLQKAICDFNASIIRCCKHLVEALRRPWQTQVRNAFFQSFQQEFSPDLNMIRICGLEVKQAIKLAKAKADNQDQKLQQLEREAASAGRRSLRQFISRVDGSLDNIKKEQLQQDLRRAVGSGKTVLTASAIEHMTTMRIEGHLAELSHSSSLNLRTQPPFPPKPHYAPFFDNLWTPLRLSDEWESRLAQLDRKPSSEVEILTTLLGQTIDQTDVFYVFIDGIDEFEPSQRRALLASLASVTSESRLRIFLSSRESLSGELRECVPAISTISMACAEATTDIDTFVKETLQERRRNGDLRVGSSPIIDDVQQALIDRADGIRDLRPNFIRVDEELGTAEFAHRAVQEFIIEDVPGHELAEFNFNPEDAEHHAGEICVTYLNFSDFVATLAQRQQPFKLEPAGLAYSALTNSFKLPRPISIALAKRRKHSTEADLSAYMRSDDTEATNLANSLYPFLAYASVQWISHTSRFSRRDSRTWSTWSRFITQGRALAEMPWPNPEEPADFSRYLLTWSLANRHFAAIRLLVAIGKIRGAEKIEAIKRTATEGDANLLDALLEGISAAEATLLSFILRKSSKRGQNEIVKLLVSAGVRIDEDNPELGGQSALYVPSKLGHAEVVRLLLSPGASVKERPTIKWHAALEAASEGGHDEVVRLLLSAGAKVSDGALLVASREGHVGVVQLLLSAGANVNALSLSRERTALEATSENGHVEVVRLLLSAGADVNACAAPLGRTALQRASEGGHVEVVQLLLGAGADVNVRSYRLGRTALLEASEGGHVEVVRLLLAAGADEQISRADLSRRPLAQTSRAD